MLEKQLKVVDEKIAERAVANEQVLLLETVPGMAHYSALAIQSRIGNVERFKHADSLANYFGLTPGCRNSGEATQRLGSITKCGSKLVRYLLNQAVIKVLRHDGIMRAWFQRIKKRRGAKIARVAVMRRLATIIWHMVKNNEAYVIGGPPRRKLVGQTA